MEHGFEAFELFLGLCDLGKSVVFVLTQEVDLGCHGLESFGLSFMILELLLFQSVVLGRHLVELVHAAAVEFDQLLQVHFVAVHDIPQTVCHHVGDLLFSSQIVFRHQTFLELLVNFIEETAGVFDLGEIWLVGLLILADVTFHDIADVGETFVCIFLGLDDGEHVFIIFSDFPLKCGTNCSLALSQLNQSLKIGFVGLQFGSEEHIALVGKLVDVGSEGLLDLILNSDLLPELVVLVVALFNEFVGLSLELLLSSLKLGELKFLDLDLLVGQFGNKLLRSPFLLHAEDFALDLRVLLDENVDVVALLIDFVQEINGQGWKLSFEILQTVHALRSLLVEVVQILSLSCDLVLSSWRQIAHRAFVGSIV